MEQGTFIELIIISAFAIPVVLLCHRMKIPVIVGFLITGILINPKFGVFKFIDIEHVEFLAELGVVCLLFSIGLEFSFKRLKQLGSTLFWGGTYQILFTLILGVLFFWGIIHKPFSEAVFLGCVISLSSTALVFALFQDKGFSGFTYVRISQAILIFQDIAAIFMVIFLPLLAVPAEGSTIMKHLQELFVKAVILATASAFVHFVVVPKGLYYVAKTRSRELFVISIVFIFISFVALANHLGISPALGAFIAGMLIAESPYNHRALGVILPFKDLFLSIFFVSVGILLDLHFLFSKFYLIGAFALALMFLKFIAIFLAVILLNRTIQTALMTSAALMQLGEFSFVLFKTGEGLGLIDKGELVYLLAAAVLSIVVTPASMNIMFSITDAIAKKGFNLGRKFSSADEDQASTSSGHVVIVGYGMIGRRVALGSIMAGLDYCVIESNPDTQKRESEKGVPIFYGDATMESTLEHANISEASIVAITVPQHESAVAITDAVRRHNAEAKILVRTRFDASLPELRNLGADFIYVEEKEVSIEMLSKILKLSLVSSDNIDEILISQAAEEDDAETAAALSELAVLKNMNEIRYLTVDKSSFVINKSLSELDLRRQFKISVIMIEREGEEFFNPSPDKRLKEDDRLLIVGKRDDLAIFLNVYGKKR